MPGPSYTNDLTTIADGDEASGWTVFSTNEQGTPSYQDSDYPYIQGQYAVTQTGSKSKTLGNLGYDYGSTITLPTDGAFLVWQLFASPFAIDDYAGTSTTYGGMHILIGANTSNFGWWDVGGSDKTPNPYGGFQCHAVNTSVAFDRQTGTYASDQVVGAGVAQIAYPSKGEPHAVDAMRFGRCSAIFEEGTESTPCTFSGFAAQNDLQNNRWGLIQETAGGYLWQGHMLIGTDTTSSYFVDSNTTIFIKWTPKVTYNFNTIEIKNEDTYLSWSGITFQVLDITTASPGRLIMTGPADVVFDQCSFTDMGEFTFDSTTDVNTVTLTDTTWRRCGEVTQGGATISGCAFINSDSTSSLIANNIGIVSNTSFESDGENHAIELTSDHAGGTYSLTNVTFTGYATENGNSGNEAIFNNSGGAVTINVTGGTYPYVRNGPGSSTSIVQSVNWYFEIQDAAGSIVSTAEFRIYDSNDVELYGVETSDGTELYSFDGALSGSNARIVVHDLSYLHFTQTLVHPSTSNTAAAPVVLTLTGDRVYENP